MSEQRWEPVPDGEYSAGKLLVHVLAGRYVVATKAIRDDNWREYWNATSLPNEYRLCRLTEQPDAATVSVPDDVRATIEATLVSVPSAEVRATIRTALEFLRDTRYVDLWYHDTDPDIRGEPVDKALAWLEQAQQPQGTPGT